MKVRSCREPRLPHAADQLPVFHLRAFDDIGSDRRKVSVHRLVFRAVLQTDVVAVAGADARKDDFAVGRCTYRSPPGRAEVGALMRSDDARDGVTAQRRKFRTYAFHVQRNTHEDSLRDVAGGVKEMAAAAVVIEPEPSLRRSRVVKTHCEEAPVAYEIAVGVFRFVDEAEPVARRERSDGVAVKVKGVVHLSDDRRRNPQILETRVGAPKNGAAHEGRLHVKGKGRSVDGKRLTVVRPSDFENAAFGGVGRVVKKRQPVKRPVGRQVCSGKAPFSRHYEFPCSGVSGDEIKSGRIPDLEPGKKRRERIVIPHRGVACHRFVHGRRERNLTS